MQNASGVDPRDRPAAGADAGDIEAAERDRMAGGPPGCRQARPAFDDQGDVGAGAAHVERDQIAFADKPRGVDAAGHTAGGSGEHGTGREPS